MQNHRERTSHPSDYSDGYKIYHIVTALALQHALHWWYCVQYVIGIYGIAAGSWANLKLEN